MCSTEEIVVKTSDKIETLAELNSGIVYQDYQIEEVMQLVS